MERLQNMTVNVASNGMKTQETLMLSAGIRNKPRFPINSLYADEYEQMQRAGFEPARYQLILDMNSIGVMMASPDCFAAVGKPGIVQYSFDEEKNQLIFSDNDEEGEGWIWAWNNSNNSIPWQKTELCAADAVSGQATSLIRSSKKYRKGDLRG